MPTISGELQTAVENPATCVELVDFTCGDARRHAEDTVELIVEQLRKGERPQATVLVTREVATGTLVGLSAIEWEPVRVQHPSFPMDAYQDAVYLAVLTLSEPYRGRWTSMHGQPLSEVLMNEAYCQIAAIRGDGMPPVQAFVDPGNTPSLALTRGQGFEVQVQWPNELMFIRPRGLGFCSRVPRPLAHSPCPSPR
ncbi:MAG TPA: hypothetical protein VHT25_03605 [Solirubrobacteraceae bacterium]|jgi:hypothetical protein|nr:hypothetical protein [Solirubrobacteraceae bacterium]